jgi:hypothetical protein
MISIFGVDYVSVWAFAIAEDSVFSLILLDCTLLTTAIFCVVLVEKRPKHQHIRNALFAVLVVRNCDKAIPVGTVTFPAYFAKDLGDLEDMKCVNIKWNFYTQTLAVPIFTLARKP